MYGNELILDIHDCDVSKFNRDDLTRFFAELCELIDMEPEDLHFWDDIGVPEEEKQTEPRLVGTSAVQFILTSNITIHTLELLKRVYLNLFSCKSFDAPAATEFVVKWFGGKLANSTILSRI